MHSSLRFSFGALLIIMVAATSGCDKRADDDAVAVKQTSLGGRPLMLFLVFGDRADPRALPIASLAGGKIAPIALDSAGWRDFDKLYFPAGSTISVYHDGKDVGAGTIRRGMWDEKTPLYKLPSCKALRPLGAVTLPASAPQTVLLEFLASSDPLNPPALRAEPPASDRDSAPLFASRAAQREGFTAAAQAELEKVVSVINTGATPHATIIASYLESGSGISGAVRHVFVVGDLTDTTKGYTASYVHVPRDSMQQFRRYVNHADLTGDGVDEILLEGWRRDGDSYHLILQWDGARWREIRLGEASWCLASER